MAVVLTALLAVPLTAADEAVAREPAPATTPGAAELAETGSELRAARATLLGRIARLTDRAEGTHARFVAAQQRLAAAEAAAAAAGAALTDHAVEAFVHSGSLTAAAGARGGVFAEVVADADRLVVEAVRVATGAAGHERASAETALAAARHAAGEVAAARRSLEATIAAHEARTATALAEEARNAAARRLAEEEQAREEASRQERARQETADAAAAEAARAAGAGAPAPAASALADPVGPVTGAVGTARQRDRTARATAEQAELLARHPFGPARELPPGATRTGAVVEGMASWYGPGFDGRPTATGALFDQEGWTVASKELPLGTVLLITRGDRAVLALVNDRGPFVAGRVLDLSRAVAAELGTVHAGVAHVRAEVVRLP